MFEFSSADALATEVRMTRAGTGNAILLLEGEDDIILYKRFFNSVAVEIVAAYGRENALSAVAILNSEKQTSGYLAIVDSDFDRLSGYEQVSNVIRTDFHDAEIGIASCKAFQRICSEYCSHKADSLNTQDISLERYLMTKTYKLSCLRYIEFSKSLGLNFGDIKYDAFIDKKNLEISEERMVRQIIESTKHNLDHKIGKSFDPQEIERLRSAKRAIPSDKDILNILKECPSAVSLSLEQATNGHDFIAVFGLALRKLIGSVDKTVADPQNMEKVFRLSYDLTDFMLTGVFEAILQWQSLLS